MSTELDAWILSQRPAREKRDPYLPYEYFVEEECSAEGTVEAGRHHLPDQSRVPVSLPDVRPVAQHAY